MIWQFLDRGIGFYSLHGGVFRMKDQINANPQNESEFLVFK